MTFIVPFFFAHQPFRLSNQGRHPDSHIEAAGLEDYYFDDAFDRKIFLKVAERCYYPATRHILDLVRHYAKREKPFRVAYGLSGTLLMQAERYAPDLLDLWKELADSGFVEFTGETYYHSLAGLFDDARLDFRAQATQHQETIQRLFGQRPNIFRNTEMLYNDAIAESVRDMGFTGMMTEGVDWLMAGWRSPNFVYTSPCGLPVLLRNYRLSDDIAYRFSNKRWNEYPLTAPKFADWLTGSSDPVILLAIDYEALGEHNGAETGIFEFIKGLPAQVEPIPHLAWGTPSQVLAQTAPVGQIDVPVYATISWADRERDTSAWLGNGMQQFCYEELKRMEPLVTATRDPYFLHIWRLMQTSDHLYYLSDKTMSDGDVHQYFSAYGSPTESFTRYHAALYDLKRRAEQYAK